MLPTPVCCASAPTAKPSFCTDMCEPTCYDGPMSPEWDPNDDSEDAKTQEMPASEETREKDAVAGEVTVVVEATPVISREKSASVDPIDAAAATSSAIDTPPLQEPALAATESQSLAENKKSGGKEEGAAIVREDAPNECNSTTKASEDSGNPSSPTINAPNNEALPDNNDMEADASIETATETEKSAKKRKAAPAKTSKPGKQKTK